MNICLYCLAMVVISTLVGALLSYLFFRSVSRKLNDELELIKRESELSSNNHARITDEYNKYKAKATQRIEDGEAEINKLNKLNLALSRDKKPGLTQSELDHKYLKWKKRSESLSSELEYLRAKVDFKKDDSTDTISSEQLADLKAQHAKALKKIREQDIQLMELKSKANSSKSKKKGTGKKKKKIKKLQEELSALKSKLKKKK